MAVDYIVIQAGGKGTRLKHLTKRDCTGKQFTDYFSFV